MEELKEKIVKEGQAVNEIILKVDSFLNHQVDAKLMSKIGEEFAEHFKDKNITKVVTIETGGIVPAVFTALTLNVPFVIFKKGTSKILPSDVYHTKVKSYTKGIEYDLMVSKKYLKKEDNILIIDDFLANGEAALGLIKIIEMAESNIVGMGFVIEKSFQEGRKRITGKGLKIHSLAKIKSLSEGKIVFEE